MGRTREPNGDPGRGVVQIVSYVLLIGTVVVCVGVIAMAAGPAIDDTERRADAETAELQLTQTDEDISTAMFSGDRATEVYLGGNAAGAYNLTDGANISVTVSNGYGTDCTANLSLERLEYEDRRGRTIAYQAGGIWRTAGTGSTVVSSPEIRYRTTVTDGKTASRLYFEVTDLDGTVGTGTHTAKPRLESDDFGCTSTDEFGLAQDVSFTVRDAQFHEAWYEFLREEFDAVDADAAGPDDNVVSYDEDDGEVTVRASLDYDRPFDDYVDVDETIYGGVYAENDVDLRDRRLTVDGYNGSAGTYAEARDAGTTTPDVLVADTHTLTIEQGGVLDGYAVSNGNLQPMTGSTVSEYGFYVDDELAPGSDDVTALEITERVAGSEPIDDDVDLARSLLEDEVPGVNDDPLRAGSYFEDDDLALTDATVDTRDGDVHVAVDGSLELADVTVEGPGTVFFYVDEDIDVTGDVTVPDDRADALRVYGSSSATAAVDEDTTFEGVLYAPGCDALEIGDRAEIYGAVVGGPVDVGEDVEVHFDRSLRTRAPVPPQNRTVEDERSPLDVSFVLDRSGSMSNNDPRKLRVDATREFVGLLSPEAGDLASVFDFNASGEEIHPMSRDLESVNESVVGNEDGWTNIATGMELALDEHEAVDDPSRPPHATDHESVMIVLSDGENSLDKGSDKRADRATMREARRAAAMNVTVYTVGLGDDVDEDLLQDVADTTGGEYVNVDESERLEDVFTDIAKTVTETVDVEFEEPHTDSGSPSNEHVVDVVQWTVELEDA